MVDITYTGKIICELPISKSQFEKILQMLFNRKWKLEVLFSDDACFEGDFSGLFQLEGFSVQFEIQNNSIFITADFPPTTSQNLLKIRNEIESATNEIAKQLNGLSAFGTSTDTDIDSDTTEEFESIVTKLTMDQYWEKICKSGWLENVDEKNVRSIKRRLSQIFPEAPVQAADCLACLQVEFNYFGESYTELLKDLSNASNQVFQPKKVEEIIDESGRTHVSFIHNGKTYSTILRKGRVDDFSIFALVNKALRDSDSAKLFGFLEMGKAQDDWIRIVFVSEAIFENAQALGIVPLQNENSFP